MSVEPITPFFPDIAAQLEKDLTRIVGDSVGNVIRGTSGEDLLLGEAGDEILRGMVGDDVIFGGAGNDKLQGGSGNDFLYGGDGKDKLSGGMGDDILVGGFGDDKLRGKDGNDALYGDKVLTADDFDSDGYVLESTISNHGNDRLKGGAGDDFLQDQLGSDRLVGGDGDDILVSISDSNVSAENPDIQANVDDGNDVDKLVFSEEFFNPDGLEANDRLIGGAGADTFKFDLLINAKENIYTQHMQGDGSINWAMNGVAGANKNYHDHWVEGIGRDVIADFSGEGGEGDKIVISGHTVKYKVIKEFDNRIVLGIYSDQGGDGVRGGGAHDLDVLGTIKINHDGNFNLENDLTLVHQDLGAF